MSQRGLCYVNPSTEPGDLARPSKDQKKEGLKLCGNVPQTARRDKGMNNDFLVEVIKQLQRQNSPIFCQKTRSAKRRTSKYTPAVDYWQFQLSERKGSSLETAVLDPILSKEKGLAGVGCWGGEWPALLGLLFVKGETVTRSTAS